VLHGHAILATSAAERIRISSDPTQQGDRRMCRCVSGQRKVCSR